VLQRQAVTPMPAVHRAPMAAPTGNGTAGSGNSRHWRPSPALLEEARQVGLHMRQQQQQFEDRTTSAFAKLDDGTASPATPRDSDQN
jgi:hypothetical protein